MSRTRPFPEYALTHLAQSGLDEEDARRLGLRWLDEAAVAELLGFEEPASSGGIQFPYFSVEGKKLGDSASRVRVLRDPRDGWTKDGKQAKYLQPPGTPPRPYFPPLVDWKKIREGSDPVFITEGEKKAAAACKHGYPCVGLGGVYSFMQKDANVELLPELAAFNWKRKVYIAFDSDWQTNKDVRRALGLLAERLSVRGAEVRTVQIHAPEGARWGLDDLIFNAGVEAFAAAVEQAPAISPEFEAMAEYHDRFVLVRTLSAAWDEDTQTLYPKQKFLDAFPDDMIQALSPQGRPTRISKAQFWWQDPRKQAANRLVLRPGQPRIVGGDLNTFKGWGVEPARGPTSTWALLLNTVFQGRRDMIKWFEQWLAYPLQNPGTKLHQSVFVFGAGQGTGKSAIGNIMCDIYGSHGRIVQDRELFQSFNGWMAQALFAMGDDLCFDSTRKSRSVFKVLTDSEKIEVNEKFVQGYQTENLCNFYLTANKAGALPLDPDGSNRRAFVVEAPGTRTLPQEWYLKTFHEWRKEGGAAFVFRRLLELDLTGFYPHADAPPSDAKNFVMETSQSNVEAWCAQIRHHCPYQLATSQELYALYRGQTDDLRTGRGIFLSSLRAHAQPLGQQRGANGEHTSLWALREPQKWRKSKPKARLRQYYAERGLPEPMTTPPSSGPPKKRGRKPKTEEAKT